ncbi:MAG: ArsR/SmtB family transcription factor [Solirubrobacterales bacterium]
MARRRKKTKGSRKRGDVQPHEAILKALSHPVRVEALGIVSGRIASPKEVAEQLGVELTNVSYHMRVLEELGLIELVEEEPVRGSVAHYFRAVDRQLLVNPAWKKLDENVRNLASGHLLEAVLTDATASLAAGLFDRRPDRHLSRTPLLLDKDGWERVNEIQYDALESVLEEQTAASKRMNGSNIAEIRVILGMFCFEMPPEEQ